MAAPYDWSWFLDPEISCCLTNRQWLTYQRSTMFHHVSQKLHIDIRRKIIWMLFIRGDSQVTIKYNDLDVLGGAQKWLWKSPKTISKPQCCLLVHNPIKTSMNYIDLYRSDYNIYIYSTCFVISKKKWLPPVILSRPPQRSPAEVFLRNGGGDLVRGAVNG
jgi:hypothetical protein